MAATAPKVEPPRRIPVMSGKRIMFRWLQQLIWLFLAATVGTLVISALYYLIVEVDWHIGHHVFLNLKPDWDHLFSFRGWAADRHDIRNVYEALLSTLFVRSLLANWRKRDRLAPAWYVAISPVLIVVVAFPIVIVGIALINYGLPDVWHALFGHHRLHNPVHMTSSLAWFGTYLSGYPWQPVLIGVVAGLLVHRVYAPAGNTVQMYFISRAVDRTRRAIAAGEERPLRYLPRWPWPPVIRERAAWIMHNDLPVPSRTYSIRIAVRVFLVVFGALAIYGGYVRYLVAKGHSF
jgi:hypothetical protein